MAGVAGIMLSGGQKQRLAVARCFLRRPRPRMAPGNGANKPFPCENIKHPFSNHVGCREFMGISTLGEFRGV